MMVYGGINDNEQILNEMWMFNVNSESWIPYDDLEGDKLPHLAMHACCSVISREIDLSNRVNIHNHTSRMIDNISNDGINIGY